MVELIDMFLPTPFNITLIASIYIIHRSFYKVDNLGFVTATIIALSANFYMTAYFHISQIAAMFISIIMFPVMEFLWATGMNKLHPEKEMPQWRIPHSHMPHFRQQQTQAQPPLQKM